MESPVLWLRTPTAEGNTGLSKKLKDGSPKLRGPKNSARERKFM